MLFVIALLVLGPKRLPEVARTAGRWMAEMRKYTSAIQGELHGVLGEPLKQTSAYATSSAPPSPSPGPLEVGAREVRSSFDAAGAPVASVGVPPVTRHAGAAGYGRRCPAGDGRVPPPRSLTTPASTGHGSRRPGGPQAATVPAWPNSGAGCRTAQPVGTVGSDAC